MIGNRKGLGNRMGDFTKVLDLDKGDWVGTYSLPPRQALIAAHAQIVHNDFNTWDYESRYGSLVTETEKCYTIGSLSVLKRGNR